MKNKKGILSITIATTAGLIVLAIVIGMILLSATMFFAWLTSNFLLIVGVLVIVLGFVFGVAKAKGKNLLGVLLIVLLVGGGIIGLHYSGLVQQIGLGEGTYINVPTWMYYECAPATEKISSPWNNVPISGTGFITCPKNSDECDVEIRAPIVESWTNFIKNYRIVYQVCDIGGECQPQQFISTNSWNIEGNYGFAKYNNLLKSQKIWIDYQSKTFIFNWKNIEGAQYRFNYKPFILWKNSVFGGGRKEFTTVEQGCTFPSSARANLIISSTLDIPHRETSNSNTKLEPYKTRNFVDKLVPISVENYAFVKYQGKEAYCTNGNIYQVDKITTNSGTYKVVNIGINPLLADLECCPGDHLPGYECIDYKWEKIEIEEDTGKTNIECSLFKPCPNSEWDVYNNKQLRRYRCINNICVLELRNVECTSNQDCKIGEVCDTKLYKCIKAPGGEIVEDEGGVDLECKWWQVAYEKDIEDCGFLNWKKIMPFVECKTYTERGCRTANWVYLTAFVIILILVVFIILLVKQKPINKFKKTAR